MKALKLNGTTDYLNLGAPLKLNQSGKGFTILAAVKLDTTSSSLATACGKAVLSNYKDAASLGGFPLHFESGANPRPCVWNLNSTAITYAENRASEGAYTIVGYTYDSTTKSISWYVNSVFPETPKAITIPDGFFTGSANMCIGADSTGGNKFPGEISYLMVSDRCLSQGEMAEKILPLLHGTPRSFKDDVLPAKAIPLGLVTAGKDSSNDGIINVDMIYKTTHRIEGATKKEGNRSVLLGVRYVLPGSYSQFYNPFGMEPARFWVKAKANLTDPFAMEDFPIYFLNGGTSRFYGTVLETMRYDSIGLYSGPQGIQWGNSGINRGWLYLYGELL